MTYKEWLKAKEEERIDWSPILKSLPDEHWADALVKSGKVATYQAALDIVKSATPVLQPGNRTIDRKDGVDVYAVFHGGVFLGVALRVGKRKAGFKRKWLLKFTVTTKRDHGGGTEIDKWRRGSFDIICNGWKVPGGPVDIWGIFARKPCCDKVLDWLEQNKHLEQPNLWGDGGGKCSFNSPPWSIPIETGAVITFSEGNPAARPTRIPVDPLDAALGVVETLVEPPKLTFLTAHEYLDDQALADEIVRLHGPETRTPADFDILAMAARGELRKAFRPR